MNTEKVDIELAYLAGLFEGEGCACIYAYPHKERNRIFYRSQLVVRMTDPEPVKRFYDRFGGSYHIRTCATVKACQIFGWCVSGKRAAEVAELLLPYISTSRKCEALKCVIKFAKTFRGEYRGCGVPSEVTEQRIELVRNIRFFNTKGIDKNRTKLNPEITSKSLQLILF